MDDADALDAGGRPVLRRCGVALGKRSRSRFEVCHFSTSASPLVTGRPSVKTVPLKFSVTGPW